MMTERKTLDDCITTTGDWTRITSDYDDVVQTFATIVASAAQNDYQGDSLYLLTDAGSFGVLQVGWGSCSGCDALQACDTRAELERLRDQLAGAVRWFDSRAECIAWIAGHDWEATCLNANLVANFRSAVAQVSP